MKKGKSRSVRGLEEASANLSVMVGRLRAVLDV